MKEAINYLSLKPGINGYRVSVSINYNDNEYFFSSYDEVIDFIKTLNMPFKEIRKDEEENVISVENF